MGPRMPGPPSSLKTRWLTAEKSLGALADLRPRDRPRASPSAAEGRRVRYGLTSVQPIASRESASGTGHYACTYYIRWRAKSGLSLARAGLGREPDQFFSGPRRRGDRHREDDPPRLSFKDNVAALGVDAGHAPGPRRGARKGRGIKLESIGMIPFMCSTMPGSPL